MFNNCELRFSSGRLSHDPFEYQDIPHIAFTSKIAEDLIINNAYEKNQSINTILKRGFKIACFCSDVSVMEYNGETQGIFHKGYARSRMWSQFADAHKGVCVIFSKSKLLESIRVQAKGKYPEGQIIVEGRNVEYSNSKWSNFSTFTLTEETLQNPHVGLDVIEKSIDAYLFTKLKDYRDEQEYRIAVYHETLEKLDYEKFIIKDAVLGIIIGDKCNEAYDVNFEDIKGRYDINIFRMSWFKGTPHLD
jgi:hypothetical protein